MGLFICERCQSIENTALGRYWTRDDASLWPDGDTGEALCSACAPERYSDGERTRYGRWHGRFPRDQATVDDLPRVKNPEAFRELQRRRDAAKEER